MRTPCMAIAPSVANAAFSRSSPSGTRATRFAGTATISAWFAWPAPAHATRSPTTKSVTSSATAVTTPALEYPSGCGASSLFIADRYVGNGPSWRTLRTT